jgi:GT2 family glycosyltransferase
MITLPTKISVLTCCYNAEDFIEEAVESILRQSNKEFEYVVADDGSTDKTLSILKRYAVKDTRIVLIEKDHSGLTASLNVGLELAKGEWIARLDADDVAMPERLSHQLKFVQDNDDVVLLGGGCIEVNTIGAPVKKHTYPQEHSALINRLENGAAFFPHSSAFFNKEVLMKMGGYNPKFTSAQDLDMFLRIGETAPMACLPMPVVKLRKHPQMISNTNQGRLQPTLAMCARICHFRRKSDLSDPSTMEEYPWRKFLKWVEKRMEEEEYFQSMRGWQSLRNAWYSNPRANKVYRSTAVIAQLVRNPQARKAFNDRLRKRNLTKQLVEESRETPLLRNDGGQLGESRNQRK